MAEVWVGVSWCELVVVNSCDECVCVAWLLCVICGGAQWYATMRDLAWSHLCHPQGWYTVWWTSQCHSIHTYRLCARHCAVTESVLMCVHCAVGSVMCCAGLIARTDELELVSAFTAIVSS